MIRRATPIRFDRVATRGRTEPLRVAVETDDGESLDVVMKISAGVESSTEGLVNEMLGSLLAGDLGLPVPEPLFVRIDRDFIDAVSTAQVQHRLRSSNVLAFGSVNAGDQWRAWSATDKVQEAQRTVALGIIAFDGFIANSDRSPRNPNLLVKGDNWKLIDHETAFCFRMKFAPPCRPWEAGNLGLLRYTGQPSEHVFALQLTGIADLDFAAIRAAWVGLSDARIAQYDALLPTEWVAERQNLGQSLAHVKQVRDNIDLCLEELKRVLS